MAKGDAIVCEVKKRFGVVNGQHILSYGKTGSFELNFVSWNKREPKFDLRTWTEDPEFPVSKGSTFNLDEAKALHKILGKAIKEVEKPVPLPIPKKPTAILIKNGVEIKS